MKHNSTDTPVIAEKDRNLPEKRLFISLTPECPYWTEGKYVVLSCGLLRDIVYEIGSELAFMVKEHDVSDKYALLVDFKAERPEEYAGIAYQIKAKLIESFFAEKIPDEVDFSFPDSYIDWLCYSTNQVRVEIGRKLRDKNGTITLSPFDIYDEYIKEGVLEKITRLVKSEPTITIYTVVNTKIAAGPFFNSIKEANPNICYKPFDGEWITHELGYMHGTGIGTEKSPHKALKLYRKAADLGSAVGAWNAGIYYEKGIGVQADQAKAFEYYLLAANRNYSRAFAEVGNRYHTGNGVGKDVVKAVEWYKKALPQKQPWVYRCLANLYREDNDVEKNLPEALRLHQFAADNGDKWAQLALGQMYLEGQGVEINEQKAKAYLQKAADAALTEAYEPLAGLLIEEACNTVSEDAQRSSIIFTSAIALLEKLGGEVKACQYLLSLPDKAEYRSLILKYLTQVRDNGYETKFMYAKFINDHPDVEIEGKTLPPLAVKTKVKEILNDILYHKPAMDLMMEINREIIKELEEQKESENQKAEIERLRAEEEKRIKAEQERIRTEEEERIRAEQERIREAEAIERQKEQHKYVDSISHYSNGIPVNRLLNISEFNESSNKGYIISVDDMFLQPGSLVPEFAGGRQLIEFARKGFPQAMAMLGFCLLKYNPDCRQAADLVVKAVDGTNEAVEHFAGMSDIYKKLDDSHAQKVSSTINEQLFTGLAANRGVTGDCYALLSALYMSGTGVEKDAGKAIRFVQEGARMGSDIAYYLLGVWHERGLGVEQNLKAAGDYYGKSGLTAAKYLKTRLYHRSYRYKDLEELVNLYKEIDDSRAYSKAADLLLTLGKRPDAVALYEKTLTCNDYSPSAKRYARYKLQSLGGSVPEEEAKNPFIPYPTVYFSKDGFSTEEPKESECVKCDCKESNRATQLFDVITAAPFHEEPEYIKVLKHGGFKTEKNDGKDWLTRLFNHK